MADKERKSTMREFAANDQANYYLGITSIIVNEKNAYELKEKFLDDLHMNAFSGTHGEDAIEHIKYFLKIVDPIDLPNVNHDKLRFVVFPISLAGDAWRWFDGIKGSITRALWDYSKLGSDEIEPTNEETSDLEETNHDDEQEIDDESSNNGWRRCDGYEIADHDQEEGEYENGHEDKERCELFDDHKLSVCNIRRFEMTRYSFGDDEEYVVVKEDEYDDLKGTSKDACREYQ
ncbi:hypothetical protein Tco_1405540 [Tanacetum coccineum]